MEILWIFSIFFYFLLWNLKKINLQFLSLSGKIMRPHFVKKLFFIPLSSFFSYFIFSPFLLSQTFFSHPRRKERKRRKKEKHLLFFLILHENFSWGKKKKKRFLVLVFGSLEYKSLLPKKVLEERQERKKKVLKEKQKKEGFKSGLTKGEDSIAQNYPLHLIFQVNCYSLTQYIHISLSLSFVFLSPSSLFSYLI